MNRTHYTVTIHDENGVRQFNLHKITRKLFLYAAFFALGVGILATSVIVYLNVSLSDINQKKRALDAAHKTLLAENKKLCEDIEVQESALQLKQNELHTVSDRLNDIELLIGLSTPENVSLTQRADLTKITSEQMAALLQNIPNGSPIEYHGITSKFGYRVHPTLQRREFHRGSDMKAKMNTPIYATADAVVEWAGTHKSSGYGRLIILDHNYGFKTLYGHLQKVVIKSGTFVKKGTLIGYTGNSGMSNGPHLHYEVRFLSRALNPFWFIKWNIENYNQIFEKEKQVPWQSLIAALTPVQQHQVAQPKQTQTPPSSQKVLLSRAK